MYQLGKMACLCLKIFSNIDPLKDNYKRSHVLIYENVLI
jgi:hypothetical protein